MVRAALTLFLACAAVFYAAGAAEPRPADEVPATRDDLWRMIFARPPEAQPPDTLAAATDSEAARAALGARLFHDQRLSGDGRRSCASCHDPAQGFGNGQSRGVGRDGTPMLRNVPSLYNLAWGKAFYWDGREPSLEAQARVPILTANEMGGEFARIVEALAADPDMLDRFAAAFPATPAPSADTITVALAAFERTIVSPTTGFDVWVAGDDAALSEKEQAGFSIFVGKGGCVACHGGWRLTDDDFHDIGLRSDDPGRGAIAGGRHGLREFKTPGLRELASTAPYMHDGSLATLRDVVEHYSGGFEKRPSLAANVRRDLRLAEDEKQALIAFLLALSASPDKRGSQGESVDGEQQPEK
ncbi:MAG: cytochrome-c peroxidase [Hyphomicrobium sp.]